MSGGSLLTILTLVPTLTVSVHAFPQKRISTRTLLSNPIVLVRRLALSKAEDDETSKDSSRTDDASGPPALPARDAAHEASLKSSFGDVVNMRRPPGGAGASSPTLFGGDAGIRAPEATNGNASPDLFSRIESTPSSKTVDKAVAEKLLKRNAVVAALSIVFALSNWVWQWAHPLEPIQLLAEMQQKSADITLIGRNDKPTIVDFWAPWCDNCKVAAPTLRQIEQEYGERVNFVMVNGDLPSAWPYIEAFSVDAIPHLALISATGDVETALIGPVPKHVLAADIDVLLLNSLNNAGADAATHQELPYKMLDVFAGKPQSARRVHFDK